MNLSGKRILVTGASRGLGRAIAQLLVEKGSTVFGTSRAPENVDGMEGVRLFPLDLTNPDRLGMTWMEGGLAEESFDIVINNAGAGTFCEFAATEFTLWDEQIDLLLRSPVALCHRVLPQMIKEGKGLIVNVTSLGAEYPIPFMNGYSVGKASLSTFSNSLASELIGSGVSILDFRPGDFDSGFNEFAARGAFSENRESTGDEVWQVIVQRMKASPSPEKIANTLIASIEAGKIGVVRAGSFFQRVVAPLFARVVPLGLQRWANESYYKIKR